MLLRRFVYWFDARQGGANRRRKFSAGEQSDEFGNEWQQFVLTGAG
jgi:hypothetical protein